MPSTLAVLDTPKPVGTQPDLGYVSSEIKPRGRWATLMYQMRDELTTPHVVPNPVPLQAAVSISTDPLVPSIPVINSRRSIPWHDMFTPPSLTGDEPIPNRENDTRSHGSGSSTPPSGVPPSLRSRHLPTSVRNTLTPILVPAAKNTQIQGYNPALAEILNPGTMLVDSPASLTPNSENHGSNVLDDAREPAPLGVIFRELASLDALAACFHSPSGRATQSTVDSWATAPLYHVNRKLLIIGSNYANSNVIPSTRLSVASTTYERLSGTENDVRDLRSTFQERGYSVETMTQEDFDRADVLEVVARFLRSASPGDVRAIVFTGHSRRYGTSLPAMIPPIAPTNTIGADDWNSNIRTHARPGVIVLSIIATCFSGGFAEQGVRITDFDHPREEIQGADSSLDVPIYITFSSSGPHETAYESALGSHETRCRDHFLWALAGTARDHRVRTWHQFVETLRERFAYARVKGAEGLREGTLPWLCAHPQHPEFTVAQPTRFPAWHSIFPLNFDDDDRPAHTDGTLF
ncbi:hypothetical protein FRC07_012707 [Ceratobasidium sp. 392]|nr:hypothetical protein FRC07_012707 [Ceratobasidium sp. 392]